jgi:hypothetical protein
MTGRGEWITPGGDERLRVAWDRGDAASAIGAAFGVSKNAIVGKAHRLGLDARPNPVRPKGTPAVPCPAPVPRSASTLPPLASDALPPAPAAGQRLASLAGAPAIRLESPVQTLTGTGTCSWLTSERPYRYCDEPVFGRLSYCECHAARVYATKGWRQREAADEPVHLPIGVD